MLQIRTNGEINTNKELLIMNLRLLIYISIFALSSCENNKVEINTINYFIGGDSIPNFIPFSGEYKTKKDSIFYNFVRYFGVQDQIKLENLEEISETESFNFKKSRDIYKLYSISFWQVPSNVWDKQYGIISNETKHIFCVISIKNPYVIDVGSKSFCIAGVQECRWGGFFSVYDLINGKITKAFKTHQSILNQSSDCIIFQPFQLVETYEDFNNDGKLDLQFKGNYLNFCSGLESGPNYYDGDQIREHGILKYIYLQSNLNDRLEFFLDSSRSVFLPASVDAKR